MADKEYKAGETTPKPILCGAAAAFYTSLPDVLEPATYQNHRQFFHSLAFAGLLGLCFYKLHQWEPETDGKHLLKGIGLLADSAYLIHLALDATTRKSFPLLGRLQRCQWRQLWSSEDQRGGAYTILKAAKLALGGQ